MHISFPFLSLKNEKVRLALQKQNCLEKWCYMGCLNSFFKVNFPLMFLYNIEVLLLKEQEVLREYWYLIDTKYQRLMKNLKWIRNSSFLSILKRFLAILVFHICFLLANGSCCFQYCGKFIHSRRQTLQTYIHTCFSKSEEWSSFSGRKMPLDFTYISTGSEIFLQWRTLLLK